MKINICFDERRSYETFLNYIVYWRKYLHLDLKIDEKGVKEAKEALKKKKRSERLERLHLRFMKENEREIEKIKDLLTSLLKDGHMDKLIELIETSTKIRWKYDSLNIYICFGTGGRAEENNVEIGFVRAWRKDELIATLIHELTHCNTNEFRKTSISREIATVIITNKILRKLGIERRQRFDEPYAKYEKYYEELEKLCENSRDFWSFAKRIRDFLKKRDRDFRDRF